VFGILSLGIGGRKDKQSAACRRQRAVQVAVQVQRARDLSDGLPLHGAGLAEGVKTEKELMMWRERIDR